MGRGGRRGELREKTGSETKSQSRAGRRRISRLPLPNSATSHVKICKMLWGGGKREKIFKFKGARKKKTKSAFPGWKEMKKNFCRKGKKEKYSFLPAHINA